MLQTLTVKCLPEFGLMRRELWREQPEEIDYINRAWRSTAQEWAVHRAQNYPMTQRHGNDLEWPDRFGDAKKCGIPNDALLDQSLWISRYGENVHSL